MAAGSGAESCASASSATFKSSLDRRFQAVSNTADSIQGLSAWCIENKKHYNLIVRHWMKWLKKSATAHRLNLFYLANDVIQNCKRKNAIVYRTSFAEVLPQAALLVRESKVRKSVERILTIWSERNIYPQELISDLRASLANKGTPAVPVNSKAPLKAKIVAEFVPQAFRQQLSAYRNSQQVAELKEKQLAALKMDICSTSAFKRLKDKEGGKKFSRDFDNDNRKVQEFVGFLEQQLKEGHHLLEWLNNADVFYEMQYREVKIIAKAYTSFASRVSNLKQKLDALKSTLPNLDSSPVPSPLEDAPSPTDSESPSHGNGGAAPETVPRDRGSRCVLGGALSTGNLAHGQWDNRDVEDMELCEGEEPEGTAIIVEQRMEKPLPTSAQTLLPARAAKSTHDVLPPSAPALTAPLSLANVDLGKISSILSSLTSAMKGAGMGSVPLQSPHSARGPAPAPAASGSLASLLSRVDTSPQGLLSALSRTQGCGAELQDVPSLQQVPVVGSSVAPGSVSVSPPVSSSRASPKDLCSPSGRDCVVPLGLQPGAPGDQGKEQEPSPTESSPPSNLEAKIQKFLQGNPGFALNGSTLCGGSPLPIAENAEGTPLRDEEGGTPTQDEEMEQPAAGLAGRGGSGAPAWRAESQQHSQSIETWVTTAPSVGAEAECRQAGIWSSGCPTEGLSSLAERTGRGAPLPAPEPPREGRQPAACTGEAPPQHPPSAFFNKPLPPIPTLPPPPLQFLPRPGQGQKCGTPTPPRAEQRAFVGGRSSVAHGGPPPWIGSGMEGGQGCRPPPTALSWPRVPPSQLPARSPGPLHPPYGTHSGPTLLPPMRSYFSAPPKRGPPDTPRRPFLPHQH
ncbi:regulation of nuclear pre-mRNA domain-containing protein 2-like isoform X1 [Paramormyrops kingsleyae]|uniref:regulation of nuclear pre-mRNA domain-containing protein 2-like isoform X1 n=1 Tax=Paramormyrops kingsleyae TaxID=1676925 RepID=UPI003B97BB8B